MTLAEVQNWWAVRRALDLEPFYVRMPTDKLGRVLRIGPRDIDLIRSRKAVAREIATVLSDHIPERDHYLVTAYLILENILASSDVVWPNLEIKATTTCYYCDAERPLNGPCPHCPTRLKPYIRTKE